MCSKNGNRISNLKQKTVIFVPKPLPQEGGGRGGAFPPPEVARVAQRPLRGRAEDAQRSSEDAPRPLRDRSEDGQKRAEDARRRLEDKVYSGVIARARLIKVKKAHKETSLCFVKRV